jgi:hypothetical protein
MITESVISSMIIHFTINATGIVTLYIANKFVEIFSNNSDLLGDIMSSTAPTKTELFLSLISIFLVALFLTPIAILLIRLLQKNHNKAFRGSLKLPTEVLMNLHDVSKEPQSFTEDMEVAMTHNTSPLAKEEKILTPSLIITILVFMVFAITLEFFK